MGLNEKTYDLSHPGVKRMILAAISNASGIHRFELTRVRDQRSHDQNSFYFGVVLKEVQAGISEAWGENLSTEKLHVLMRQKFLTEPVVNMNTGEVMGEVVKSTTELDTKEFSEYIDQIAKFAGEYLGVTIPEADKYYRITRKESEAV